MKAIYEIFAALVLCAPLIWELLDDRHGEDKQNKRKDVFVRFLIAVFVGSLIAAGGIFGLTAKHNFYASVGLSLGIHFLLFDYIVAYTLIDAGIIEQPGAHWFSYMGKTSETDQLWKRINPWCRLAIKMVVFVGCLIWYCI